MVEKNVTLPAEVVSPQVEAPVPSTKVDDGGGSKRIKKEKRRIVPEPIVAETPKPTTEQTPADASIQEEQERKPVLEKANTGVPIKRKRRKSPVRPIEHKRVVHYYREAGAYKAKNSRSKDKGNRKFIKPRDEQNSDSGGSDSDWDDASISDRSDDNNSDSDEDGSDSEFEPDDTPRITKHKPSKAKYPVRDNHGKFTAPPITQYRIV